MTPDPGRTALYRLYSAGGWLLYVGIATDPEARFTQHKADKRWWREVVLKRVEWYATRREAEAAEIAAIRSQEPEYNREHSPGAVVEVRLPHAVHATGLDLLCKLLGRGREDVLADLLLRELAARGLLGDGPCFHMAMGWPAGIIVEQQAYGEAGKCCCGAFADDPPDFWYRNRLAAEAAGQEDPYAHRLPGPGLAFMECPEQEPAG